MKDGPGGTAQGRRCDEVGKGVETVILESLVCGSKKLGCPPGRSYGHPGL